MAFRSRCWRWASPGPIRSPRSPTPRFKSIVSSSDDTQQARLSSENDRSLNSFERAAHAEPGYLADPARFRRARQLSELQRPHGDLARHRGKVRLGILDHAMHPVRWHSPGYPAAEFGCLHGTAAYRLNALSIATGPPAWFGAG